MIDFIEQGRKISINTDLMSTFESIGDLMYRSVQMNFIAGGRPNQWEGLQPLGEPSHLYKTGKLQESVQLKWTDNSATVYVDTARVPYAKILHRGGTIKHPGSDKFQVFPYMGGMVYTHGTPPHDINIPARPFMMFQEQDRIEIKNKLRNSIVVFQ